MEKDLPLKIEILSEADDDQYRISSPREIESVLRQISEKGNRVALYFNDANEFVLTTLLAADKSGLWLEHSPNDSSNKRIAGSHKLVFVSSHNQVKVQFTANKAVSQIHQDRPAFHLAFPETLYRLQRREYFRLMAPVINPLRCILAAGKKSAAIKPLNFIIMDICCGGVGLTCKESDTELTPGSTYPDCQVDLPEVGTIKGMLEVKNLVKLTTASGEIVQRAGCEFKNLDGKSAIMLQKYVTKIQMEKVKEIAT